MFFLIQAFNPDYINQVNQSGIDYFNVLDDLGDDATEEEIEHEMERRKQEQQSTEKKPVLYASQDEIDAFEPVVEEILEEIEQKTGLCFFMAADEFAKVASMRYNLSPEAIEYWQDTYGMV